MAHSIQTRRLRLRQLELDEARDLLEGRPHPERPWAAGYPTEGAVTAGVEPGPYGVYQLVLHDGTVVGDLGFYGPPTPAGVVTVGYGLAPGARGHGYATE